MLRPRISLEDHFTILVAAVKILAWLLSIVAVVIVAIFKFGAICSRRCSAAMGPAHKGTGQNAGIKRRGIRSIGPRGSRLLEFEARKAPLHGDALVGDPDPEPQCPPVRRTRS
jgi:hypothetical protein